MYYSYAMAGVSLLPRSSILCDFSHDRRVHYNDFTTFEKCSDMIISLEKLTILQGRK